MAAAAAAAGGRRDWAKWAFFAVMGLCTLVAIYADERFLLNRADPQWKRIAPFQTLLAVHGPLGAIALLLGPLQFSDRLRQARPQAHRLTGRVYVIAIAISAPMAILIGTRFERREIHVEQAFQGGLWFLTTMAALACILARRIAAHKLWMMRSYGLCLVFVLSRVPDAWPGFHLTGQGIADVLWGLTIAALVLPDVVLALREPRRARPRRAVAAAA